MRSLVGVWLAVLSGAAASVGCLSVNAISPERAAVERAAIHQDLSEPSLNPLDGLHAFEKLLVGFRVLDDDFGLAVNHQDQRLARLLEAIEQLGGVALEIRDRMSLATSNIAPHQIRIEFDDRTRPGSPSTSL